MISRVHASSLIAVAAFLSLPFWTNSICMAQKTLAWKFKPNAVTNVLFEQDTRMQMESADNTKLAANQVHSIQSTNISWIVKDVALDGLASIEQMINRVQLDVKSSAGDFLIDTNNNQPLAGLGESMAKGVRPLAGTRFLVKTKSNGEVVDVMVPEEVSKKLRDATGPLGEAGLREIAINGSLQFPSKPIEVGENWSSKYQLDMPPFGKVNVNTTYQYLGEENVGGKLFDRIKATTAVKLADPSGSSGIKLKSQESSGVVWFDNVRGSIDHAEFKQDMTINVVRPNTDKTKPGIDVKQIMNQTLKMTFTPQS